MNSEGFAFARWAMIMAQKHRYLYPHSWTCSTCRNEWISLQIMALASKIQVERIA